MTTTQLRIEAACQVVRLRAKADRATDPEEARLLTLQAERIEKRYRQLRAKESAELLNAARDIGWEPVI